MAQPATCSAMTFLLTGCEPAISFKGATSSQRSVAAEILGRRNRNAAPAMEAKTPSGISSKKERRGVVLVMSLVKYHLTFVVCHFRAAVRSWQDQNGRVKNVKCQMIYDQ